MSGVLAVQPCQVKGHHAAIKVQRRADVDRLVLVIVGERRFHPGMLSAAAVGAVAGKYNEIPAVVLLKASAVGPRREGCIQCKRGRVVTLKDVIGY